jgi:hypothetical protein
MNESDLPFRMKAPTLSSDGDLFHSLPFDLTALSDRQKSDLWLRARFVRSPLCAVAPSFTPSNFVHPLPSVQ